MPNPPLPQGNPMKLTVTFKDATGAAFDPTSDIFITVDDPNGNSASYLYPGQLTKDGVGVYSVIIEATVGGGDYLARGQGKLADGTTITTPDVAQRVMRSQVR